MSDSIFDESDKQVIVEHIKKWVKKNGYVSTIFACLDAVKKPDGTNKEWDRTEGDIHKEAFVNSVSAKLLNTGEYIRQENKYPYDYDILLNPAFFLNRSVTTTSKITMVIACLAVGISLMNFFQVEKVSVKELQEANSNFRNALQNIDSLKLYLEKINSSINKIRKDTTLIKR